MKNKTLLGLGSIGFRASSGIRAALAVSAVSLLAIGSAHATSLTWDPAADHSGSGGVGNWNDSTQVTPLANWYDGSIDTTWNNATPDSATFGGTGGTVTLTSGITANSLTFSVGGYTIASGTLTFGGATPGIVTTAAAAISSAINTGGLDVLKSGAGTLSINGSTLTGGGSLDISTGQLSINSAVNLGTTNINVEGGNSMVIQYGSNTSGGSITLGAGSQLGIKNGNGGNATISSNIILNAGSGSANAAQIGGFIFGNATNLTGVISGNGDLRWVSGLLGGGTNIGNLTASSSTTGWAANSYVGATSIESGMQLVFNLTNTVNNGTVTPFGVTTNAVTIGGGAGASVTISVGTGAGNRENIANKITFAANTGAAKNNFSSIDSDLHLTGTVNFLGNTTIKRQWGLSSATGAPTKSLVFDGVVSGTSTITLQTLNTAASETGVTEFTNNSNTFSGTVVVNNTVNTAAGTAVVIGGNTALQNATLNLNGNGTGFTTNRSIIFASGITAPVIGSLTGNGNVTLATDDATPVAVNLSVGNNNAATNTYSGVLSGAGAFTKIGTGVQVLSGPNTYSGTTTVSSGILATDNAAALGTSAVTVSGGTLQVGNGTVETLTGIKGLAISGGTLDLKTNTGSVSLASGNFTMSLGTWALNNNSTSTGGNVDQITLAGGGTYSLTGGTIDLSGFTNNSVAGTYNIIGGNGASSLTNANFTGGNAGFTYSVDSTGDLLVVAVPEPSTLVLAGIFGFGMLMLFRRRRA